MKFNFVEWAKSGDVYASEFEAENEAEARRIFVDKMGDEIRRYDSLPKYSKRGMSTFSLAYANNEDYESFEDEDPNELYDRDYVISLYGLKDIYNNADDAIEDVVNDYGYCPGYTSCLLGDYYYVDEN